MLLCIRHNKNIIILPIR